jgi:hypothetical protein
MKPSHLATTVLFACVGVSACEDPPIPPFEVVVRVDLDTHSPLPGVPVFAGGKQRGVTGPDGLYKMKIGGADGDTIDVRVECPKGTRPQESNQTHLVVRHLEGARATEYQTACLPAFRTTVVAVRAINGANLPITYLGSLVARTDAAGAAHVAIVAPPNDDIRLTVDTSMAPMLRPANPVLVTHVPDRDSTVGLETTFTIDNKAAAAAERGK